MKLNLKMTLMILRVKQKFIIAVYVGKCCPPLVHWIGICWYIQERGHFHAIYVDKHSQQMEICTGIPEPTEIETRTKVNVAALAVAMEEVNVGVDGNERPVLITLNQ